MKITDLWKIKKEPTISFELFPARTEKAAEKLSTTIDILADLNPDFTSVTFGAGGSTREGSYLLLKKLKEEKHLEVIGYFAGFGLSPAEILTVLDSYQELGIENILVVRGDIPRDDDSFSPHPESFRYASDLLAFIRPRYDFCIGVAAYPEGHIESESLNKDLQYLKLKADLGAEYIITNYAYDNNFFYAFRDRCLKSGIELPITPGVMPIYSEKLMDSLAKLCGASITPEIRQGLAHLPAEDKAAVLDFGIRFAYQQCKDLLGSDIPGIHIYTMDRHLTVAAVINRLREEGLI
ncbi:MAG: methylenetetrahydrofolate reductase [Chloroflexota bacterium]|nr:MAG: methylenetetrahydrofolate reductase [Chloroflexota bacterium]